MASPESPAKKKDDTDLLDREIKIAGVMIRIPFPLEVSRLKAEQLPGQILKFNQCLAAAEEQKILIGAEYRQWRAIYIGDLLKRDRKISEWKVKAKLESEPDFCRFKTASALAEKHVLILRAVTESLRARVELLC